MDIVWSVDAELDDLLLDAKVAATNAESASADATVESKDLSVSVAQVLKTRQNANSDKGTLATLLRRLLVNHLPYLSLHH